MTPTDYMVTVAFGLPQPLHPDQVAGLIDHLHGRWPCLSLPTAGTSFDIALTGFGVDLPAVLAGGSGR